MTGDDEIIEENWGDSVGRSLKQMAKRIEEDQARAKVRQRRRRFVVLVLAIVLAVIATEE
jgi:hypothetical protein